MPPIRFLFCAVLGLGFFSGWMRTGSAGEGDAAAASLRAARPLVVAYVPTWIPLAEFAPRIAMEKLTHLNLAFENPQDEAGTLSFNPGCRAVLERARPAGVKVLISIGGGAASGDPVMKARYAALLAPERREAFAGRLAEYVRQHGFDGLDVDLEGPSIDGNYGAFIEALATRLKPQGKLLTAALSQGYGGGRVPDSALSRFDFVNIMAYDGSGYWQPDAPGPHSSYEFAVGNTEYWLRRGLPPEKAVLGLPFYGYGFGEAFRKRDYPWKTILREFPGSEDSDQAGSTVYYNGRPTIRKKCRFVLERGLAGAMIWSLDSDVAGPHSLLEVIHTTFAESPARKP